MHRLRIIAGPNGSGKTTLIKDLRENYQLNFKGWSLDRF